MNLSELLIGNNMNAHPDCLGIYIGIDEIYVAQTSKREGGVALESLIRVPVNFLDKSRLKPLDLNESFFEMEYWQDALAKVTAKKSWNTNKVVVSLAPDFCILRHFIITIPMKRQEWKVGIPNEAQKYIHFPFDKATYAYHAYEFETAATKQKRLGVVFTMTTKSIVASLEKGLKAVGLDLVSVEPASVSMARALSDNDKEAVGKGGRIYSFFGRDTANFVFLNGQIPVLERNVDIAGSNPSERRRFELANSAAFISKQLERDPFEEAVITGYHIEQWQPVLEADSHKPVRRWNLREVFGIDTRSAGEVAAIGASGKFFEQKGPDIDFTKGKRLSAYEFNASWIVWKITILLSFILLAFLAYSYVSMLTINYQLKNQKSKMNDTIDDFQGLGATQLQANLDNIKKQNEALGAVDANTTFITPILVDIANSVPNQVWLTRVAYTSDYPSKKLGDGALIIEGNIDSGKDGGEDMLLGSQLQEKVVKQPSLRRICRNVKISYPSVAGAVNKSGKQKGNLAVTRFVLHCSSSAKKRG